MTAKSMLPQRLVVYVTDGPFTRSEEDPFFQEDPRRRNNFRLGLHAEISVRVVPKQRSFERELKMAGDSLGPSALVTGVNKCPQ